MCVCIFLLNKNKILVRHFLNFNKYKSTKKKKLFSRLCREFMDLEISQGTFSCKWVIDRPINWVSLVVQLVRIHLYCRVPQFNSWVRKILWRRDRLHTPVFLGFPGFSDGKESTCNEGHMGLIPGLGRSPGGGHGNPLQYSSLENPYAQRSQVITVCGVSESWTRLSQ